LFQQNTCPGSWPKLTSSRQRARTIACISVNDAFVMGAWGKDQKADGKVMMLGDGQRRVHPGDGAHMDGSKFGLGTRSQRYAMVVPERRHQGPVRSRSRAPSEVSSAEKC